jgi:hypothetical protein
MARFAKVTGGNVVSIILADAAFNGHNIAIPPEKDVPVGAVYDAATGFNVPDRAPAAPPRIGLTRLEFMDLFTPAEEGAIRLLARSTDPAQAQVSALMESLLRRIEAADVIYLDDARVVDGINGVRSLGILATDARRDEVLAGQSPA